MRLEIVPGKRRYCGPLARYLRVEHDAALRRMNVPIHRELRLMFDGSYYTRAAFVDGHLSAMWGLYGSLLDSEGLVWLVLAQHAVRYPKTILRVARAEIEKMAEGKSLLFTTVVADDIPSQRLAAYLGFQPKDGGMPRATDRDMRRDMVRYFQNNPDLMVEAGASQQIGVIYRARGAF